MTKTMLATFDGQVLRPESVVDLELNQRYLITLQTIQNSAEVGNVWDLLESLAGTVEAPPDWALEHDHYLYGTPKRYSLES